MVKSPKIDGVCVEMAVPVLETLYCLEKLLAGDLSYHASLQRSSKKNRHPLGGCSVFFPGFRRCSIAPVGVRSRHGSAVRTAHLQVWGTSE